MDVATTKQEQRERHEQGLVRAAEPAQGERMAEPGAMVPGSSPAAIIAREQAEIQAAAYLAKQFPRNELERYEELAIACRDPDWANPPKGAVYSFPRGGTQVEGPSVYLAREAARCWRNVQWGLRIVSADDSHIHIRGFAFDLETNNKAEAEDRFKPLIQRVKGRGEDRKTFWIKPDERDLRELVNRRGAICTRNAILQVLPDALVKYALDTVARTTRERDAKDPKAAMHKLMAAFNELKVPVTAIEKWLGHGLNLATPDQIGELRGIWQSIKDGVANRNEFFVIGTSSDEEPADKKPVGDRLADKAGKKAK